MKAKGGDHDFATSNRHRHPLAFEARGAYDPEALTLLQIALDLAWEQSGGRRRP
jgi:hypothetical protein